MNCILNKRNECNKQAVNIVGVCYLSLPFYKEYFYCEEHTEWAKKILIKEKLVYNIVVKRDVLNRINNQLKIETESKRIFNFPIWDKETF